MIGIPPGPRGGPATLGPNVAGTWYPAAASELLQRIDDLLERTGPVGPPQTERVRGLIAPHAGLVYSGVVAGKAFRNLLGHEVARVVLLGPAHYSAVSGLAFPCADRYETPLGEVKIDRAAIEALSTRSGIVIDDAPFSREHCLEAELPFLQRTLVPGWELLPGLFGASNTPQSLNDIAESLAPFVDADTLLVVSSDFTHFGRSFGYLPFEVEIQENLRSLDLGAVRSILSGDPEAFRHYLDRTGATICGRTAIEMLLRLLPEGTRGRLISYETSGEMTGDWTHSVSYVSMEFVNGKDAG